MATPQFRHRLKVLKIDFDTDLNTYTPSDPTLELALRFRAFLIVRDKYQSLHIKYLAQKIPNTPIVRCCGMLPIDKRIKLEGLYG